MDDELLFRSATGRATPNEEQWVHTWLAASPGNERRMLEVTGILSLVAEAEAQLGFGPAPTGEELLRKARAGAQRRGHSPGWRTALLAAAVAIVALGVPVARQLTSPEPAASSLPPLGAGEFLTETQPATVGLRDGTVVRLAADSRLRVHDRPQAREVSLAGRGYFAVAHDPAAPFTISSDAGTVTVLGTRFDLTVVGEDLRLIVIEGRVRLAARGSQVEVRAGQLAQIIKGNLVPPIDVPDAASMVGWVGNFIAFRNTPLRTVAREIERLHGVRLEFTDPGLGDRAVTALFAGRSFDEIAEVICVVTHLECTREGDALRMAPAPDSAAREASLTR